MPPDFNDDPEGLNRILESIPEFVLMIDLSGTIRYINRVEPGFDRDKVIGTHAESVLFPGSIRAFREAFDLVLSGAETTEHEAEVTLPDGTGAWYRTQMAAYRSGGVVVGVVLVAANITELRRAQESADALRKLLSICSWCDRIQNEAGNWESIETYLGRKEAAKVSHGMCEECYKRQMQGLGDSDEADERRA